MTSPLPKEILERSEICNKTQYHITNAVQPHYVVLILNPHDYKIVFSSDNASRVFQRKPEDIIGKKLLDLMEADNAEKLSVLLTQEKIQDSSYDERFVAQVIIANTGFKTDAIFYRNQDYICAEIETDLFRDISTNYLDRLFFRLAGNINAFQGKSSELANLICKTIEKIIGFDRIWYCEFDENGSGYVSGEYNNGVFPSLFQHRFPSTDIPDRMRSIYVKNKTRAILDVNSDHSTMVDESGKAADSIDFTYSLARRVGETHLEYLRNMGVGASASFSVMKDGKLVAIFGAHSKKPALIKHQQLSACQYLVDKYLIRYELTQKNESMEELKQKESSINNIMTEFAKNRFDIKQLLQEHTSLLAQLVNSDGCLYYINGTFHGNVSISDAEAKILSELILKQIKNNTIFYTDSIANFNADISKFKADLCGILAVSLNEHAHEHEIILWYRKEHAYDEKWAGNPSQAVMQDNQGKVGPRTSFESWIRTVNGKSVSWKNSEITAIHTFRQTFLLKRAVYYGFIGIENAKRMNAVLNTVVDGIISITHEGIIQAFNPAAERIFGYSSEEVIGKNVKTLMPPEYSQNHDGYIQKYLAGGEAKVIGIGREVLGQRKDGSRFPMELGISEMKLGKESFFVGITRDVSERKHFENSLQKAKEEAEKANAFKSQFLANMSHELRTPLHTMIGFVESIMEKIDSMPKEKQMQYLEVVHGSSERLLVLINDLLDLAKLEAGMMKFRFSQHALKPVIESSIKEVSKIIQDKKLHISLEADNEIHLVFDRERMVQVLVNLLSNAAKFTPEGKSITVHVEMNEKSLRLEVKDQGLGIPEEELDAVFDKFVQSSKTKTDAGGTGLGLSICKEIIQAHRGLIWAENNQDGGASFFIEFPVDMEERSITI